MFDKKRIQITSSPNASPISLVLPLFLFLFLSALTALGNALAGVRRGTAANARPLPDHRFRETQVSLPVRTAPLEDVGHVVVR